jgi:hypothetical protein
MIVPDGPPGVYTHARTNGLTGAPSRWLPVIPDAIPRELTDTTSWYLAVITPKAGKVGVWDKVPSDPATARRATWSDPSTRCTFGEAFMAYEAGRGQGVGYMMSADAGVIGIDLDHCISPDGTVSPWAQAIVDTFPGAYWERSISGRGLRGFCRGALPVGGCRSKVEGCSVELYADARFLVVTGQALDYVEVLPDLQDAVEALHARLTAGRVRVTGAAIGSGLTGRLTTVPPEGLAILEAALSDRHSIRILEIWSREDLHVAGASEDDWALACELVFQAIRRGHAGAALAQLVEETMRGGPYRPKWDERRGSTTWLGQDIANAIATTQKRLGDRPIGQAESETATATDWLSEWPETVPLCVPESLEQTIARQARELVAARMVQATQQVVIRAERAEASALKARLGDIMTVLRNDHLSPTSRVVAVVLGETVEQLRAHDHPSGEVARADLARKAGVSEATITREMKQLCHDTRWPSINAEAPIWKTTATEWREVDGQRLPTSRVSIGVNTELPVLAAFATYQPPEIRTHGGRRVKGCPDHPTADLIIRSTTHCAACGQQLGEPTESLRKQVDRVGEEPPSPVSGGYSGEQVAPVGGHDGEEQSERAAQAIPLPFDFEEARARKLREQDDRVGPPSSAAPWRCRCDCGCRAYERYPQDPAPGEAWRCEGCSHGSPAAVSGGAT